jgi:uncharacterized protein (TIGR02594 family)
MQTTLGEAIAAEARREVGKFEWAQGSNPAIEQYWRDAGMDPQTDDVPWCAAFVGGILGRCGILGTGKPNARSYLEWGTPVSLDELQPGDVIVSWRGAPSSWMGHVEIVTEIRNGQIITVGGNESDAVREAPYKLDKMLGARRAPVPRAKPSQSRTVQATTVDMAGKVATAATAGASALGALDWRVALAVIGAVSVLGLVLGVVVFRERLKAFAAGWR